MLKLIDIDRNFDENKYLRLTHFLELSFFAFVITIQSIGEPQVFTTNEKSTLTNYIVIGASAFLDLGCSETDRAFTCIGRGSN
ncbi:hypothetical protein NSTC745_02227 [Nostoc sp. DSM 114161]|jgi:hypothetical protein